MQNIIYKNREIFSIRSYFWKLFLDVFQGGEDQLFYLAVIQHLSDECDNDTGGCGDSE